MLTAQSGRKDLEKRRKINHVLGMKEDRYELAEDFGIK